MTEWLLNALATGGVPILAVITCLSCLAMPVPASLMMLGAGALAVSGDLSLPGALVETRHGPVHLVQQISSVLPVVVVAAEINLLPSPQTWSSAGLSLPLHMSGSQQSLWL